MRTQRHSFVAEPRDPGSAQPAAAGDPARWCATLRPGRWLVEAGSEPPRAHQPGRLLPRALVPARERIMAITLRSASILPVDLAPALVQRLAAQDCHVTPLAAVALHELILNAAIHGNLGVVSGTSRAWTEFTTRESRIGAALGDPVRAARVVTVALAWDPRRLVAVVADQGDGYDARQSPGAMGVPTTPARDRDRKASGRGLLIARSVAHLDVRRGGRAHQLVFERTSAAAS